MIRIFRGKSKNMVFYETCLMFHKGCSSEQMRRLLRRSAQVITENRGRVMAVQDLGWRNTAYPCSKPRVGIFHYGRWMSLTYGTSPKAITDLETILNHDNGLLRHITTKTKNWRVLPERTSFYEADPVHTRDHQR